jgi:hypothetical protein
VQENVLTEFRGDCFHGVSGFTTATPEEARISLVLEQFRVPQELYHLSWEWRRITDNIRIPLETIRQNPSYHVLKEAHKRKIQNTVRQ